MRSGGIRGRWRTCSRERRTTSGSRRSWRASRISDHRGAFGRHHSRLSRKPSSQPSTPTSGRRCRRWWGERRRRRRTEGGRERRGSESIQQKLACRPIVSRVMFRGIPPHAFATRALPRPAFAGQPHPGAAHTAALQDGYAGFGHVSNLLLTGRLVANAIAGEVFAGGVSHLLPQLLPRFGFEFHHACHPIAVPTKIDHGNSPNQGNSGWHLCSGESRKPPESRVCLGGRTQNGHAHLTPPACVCAGLSTWASLPGLATRLGGTPRRGAGWLALKKSNLT